MRIRGCMVVFILTGCVDESDVDPADDEYGEIETSVTSVDSWSPKASSPPIRLRAPNGLTDFAPIHATVMPHPSDRKAARVMFLGITPDDPAQAGDQSNVGIRAGMITPTTLGAAPPAQVNVVAPPVPVDAHYTKTPDNLWMVTDTPVCGGQTLLADGRLFVAGGTRLIEDQKPSDGLTSYMFGTPYSLMFDGTAWKRVSEEFGETGGSNSTERWYSTTTRLQSGKVLVTGGFDLAFTIQNKSDYIYGTANRSVELFDPAREDDGNPSTNPFSRVSTHAATPTAIFNRDYSHVFQLPVAPTGHDVLVLGETANPVKLRVADGSWLASGKSRPGTVVALKQTPNHGASSTMLPLRLPGKGWGYNNGAVMVAGGTHDTAHERSIDVYDPVTSAWRTSRVDMGVNRHHPSTVLLPDGKVLVVAGHDDRPPAQGSKIQLAQYVDPANGFSILDGSAPMGEVRGYHTVAVLLPDGRVLVGGGRTAGEDADSDEKPTFRYLHPPYLAKPRPTITSAPAQVGYGQQFSVGWQGDVADVVLVSLGSMTHSFDMNQRYVQLAIASNDTVNRRVTVKAPATAHLAPPGHYMLFVLDKNRIPSAAWTIRIGS